MEVDVEEIIETFVGGVCWLYSALAENPVGIVLNVDTYDDK